MIKYSLFLSIFLLAPEFASMWVVWVIASVVVTYVIVSLAIVQDMLEDPFWYNVDDIDFNLEDRVQWRIKYATDNII